MSIALEQSAFRPDIEGLRAIAILLVVAAHAGVPWLAGGFIGVDVFFVLSGFLITGKLVQETTATGRIRLLPFYVRRLRRLLPPLQWLGRISYSWYLWHWPVLLLGVAYTGSQAPEYRALLAAVSLALAAASHALVEAPLRRWRQWLAFPRTAVLVSLAGMAAASALATHWTRQASDALQTPALQRYAAARTDAPAIYAMGCDDWYRSAAVRICSFGSEQAPRTAVLMGDSHVGQWFPAVRGALDAHWRVLVITKSSCPMVDEPFFYTRIGREYTECAQWRDAALRQVQALKPDLFIFGSAPAGFTQQQWTEGTARVLAKLSPAAGRIILLADTPALPFDGPECLMQHALRPAWLESGNSCSASSTNPQASAIQKWLRTAAARFPNVAFVDMAPDICPNGLCEAELEGRITYRDNQHLSGSFAAALAPPGWQMHCGRVGHERA